ncbi:MAG: DUF4388 domain-containing protein [Deltaproteobacteria bacterium]|nr:DUF4388 domain-containing protein [Deltaproteobacteria bacterium]
MDAEEGGSRVALKGILEKDGCADVIQLLGRQNKSGLLRLRAPPRAVDIWMHNGLLIRVEDKQRDVKHRLGEMLVRAGLITRAALLDALNMQQRTGKKIGAVLLEGRFVPQPVLADFIRLQTRETLFNAFSLASGTYEFVVGATTTMAAELRPGMKWEIALMEGVRRTGEWPDIRRVIPSNGHTLRVKRDISQAPSRPAPVDTGESLFDLGDDGEPPPPTGPSEEEKLLFSLVGKGTTVQRVVDLGHLGEFDSCRLLARMVADGYLEVVLEEQEISESDTEVVLDDEPADAGGA